MNLYRLIPKGKSDAHKFDALLCKRCLKRVIEKNAYAVEKLYEKSGYCNYCGRED